ncbi:phosphoglyceromutase [Rhodocytophaga rosea]|uniref:Phosphoglyceromutase n=1 Tax=Rhodocytophaga rosea TaxID=2704465 RepID=A0A6C0GK38_9BACT|nr:phosphoglyceromutase [Rhodocytophaga rosea]QHT68184.1 phosphoglyceromutase [Rhodocytophaga rosea]
MNIILNKCLPLIGLFTLILISGISQAQTKKLKTEHVFIITFDGLRWEELFNGATDSLISDKAFVDDTVALAKAFGGATPQDRRIKLMPWFWQTMAKQGQLYGNRLLDNKVTVSNPHWFSYPGYNEILTGFGDPAVNSNDKVDNKHTTVLEWLNQKPAFKGKVAFFGSWDVFPYIVNEKRSGIPVNAGYRTAQGKDISSREAFLNELQPQVPVLWGSVRMDAFTHQYALEYMKRKHPRVLHIAYGETDDFAHEGHYDKYLHSAQQTDAKIGELWEYVQSDPFYAGKTTFIITTDHGRGNTPKGAWRSHGDEHKGSNAIWFAVMGPDTPASGEMKTSGQWWQNQVASTVAAFLGLEYTNTFTVGKPVLEMMK